VPEDHLRIRSIAGSSAYGWACRFGPVPVFVSVRRSCLRLLLATPRFWYQRRRGPLARLLQPLAWLYGLAVGWDRARTSPVRLPVPVVSVGNITLGGTGKTPLVIALARELERRGWRVAVLLRGYGRKRQAPCRVGAHHPAAAVGDEALEYRQQLPEAQVWVGRDRVASGRAAIAAGATLLLLDDGLQHWRLARDCDISVLDRSHGLGNGLLFPAGPMREPAGQLGRAALLVLTGSAAAAAAASPGGELGLPWPGAKPQLPVASWIEPPPGLAGQPLVAFCGIGLPAKFFEALDRAGLAVVERLGFPDHHPYAQRDLERLQHHADAHRATLVTTLKDWQRLPAGWRQRVVPLPLVLDPEAVDAIVRVVERQLGGATGG
jgi:tetraacyldisaccharide 4'-kinase